MLIVWENFYGVEKKMKEKVKFGHCWLLDQTPGGTTDIKPTFAMLSMS